MGPREAYARCRLVGAALLIGLALAARAQAQPARDPDRDAMVDDLVRTAWREFKAKHYEDARMKLERAELLAPERADVHFQLGETMFWLGRHADAQLQFQRTIRLVPTMAIAYHGFGQSCLVLALDDRTDPRTRSQLLDRAERAFRITVLLDWHHESALRALRKLPEARLRPQPYPLAWLVELVVILVFVLTVEAGSRLRQALLSPARWLDGAREYRWPLLFFFASRALVLGAFALAPALAAAAPEHPRQIVRHAHPVLDAVAGRWDSNIYSDVAAHGYRVGMPGISNEWSSIGEFPLLPVLHRSLAGTLRSEHVSALLLPHVALLLASLFLYTLFRRMHGERAATIATAVLLLHPGSLFGSVLYTEGLALLGMAGLVYCLERDAPFEAALWGVFAGLARFSCLAIVPWLLFSALQRTGRDRRRRLWPALCPLLGSALFMLYLQLQVGDGLLYFRELRGVRFEGHGPFVALSEAVEMLAHLRTLDRPLGGPWPVLLLALSCLGAYLLVLRAQLRARDYGPALFIGCGLLLALTSSLAAQPRYLWLLFAAAPWIARAVDRPGWRYALAAIACAVLVAEAIAFSRWYYVT